MEAVCSPETLMSTVLQMSYFQQLYLILIKTEPWMKVADDKEFAK
jgi:hypothetical protein